jgi:hypothetical protein
LNVEGRNRDDEDWTSIPVDAVVKGRPVTVALNRRYLLNALRFGLNQVEMEDPLSPVVFSNGGRKMVIMPVKLDGPVKAATPAQSKSGATTATTPTAEQTAPPENLGVPTEERTDMPRGIKPAEKPESTSRGLARTRNCPTHVISALRPQPPSYLPWRFICVIFLRAADFLGTGNQPEASRTKSNI